MSESELRAVATELLRLYDWRFELAKEQQAIDDSPNFDGRRIERERELGVKLRQYGREKKAAWDSLRALLARPVDEPQQELKCDCAGEHRLGCIWFVPSADTPTDPQIEAEDFNRQISAPTNERVEHIEGQSDNCLHCCKAQLERVRERLMEKEQEIEGRLRVWELQRQQIERLTELLECAHDVIHRTADESVATHNAITEELGRSSHKEKV